VVVQGFFWMHVRTLFNHQQIYRSRKLVAVTDDKIRVDERGELRFRSDWLERPPLNSQLIALAARQWLNRELGERTKDWVDYVRPGAGAEGLWSLAEALILETADMLKEQGVAYVPFLVPAGLEIDPSMWGNIGWTEPTPPADADPRIPARRFEAIFAKAGRKVLLPHDELRRQGGVSLYFRRDGHWNAEGHRVIGEFLTPYVKTALEAP
jgi:hypothetical protein